MATSSFKDTLVHDRLCPTELWPQLTVTTPDDHPLNAAAVLLDQAVAEGYGDKPAILFEDETWTYAELLAEANRMANVLVNELEVVPGQRVLLRGPNRPRLAAAWFATLKAGAVAVTVMPMLRARELAEIIDRAVINVVLFDPRAGGHEVQAALDKSISKPAHVMAFDLDTPGNNGPTLETRANLHPTTFTNVATSPEDPALIAFTSGTTGRSKGTVHFHRDVVAICDLFPREVLKPCADDVFCGTPSLGFTYGLGGLLLFPFRMRATTVFLDKPDALLRTIEQRRATVVFSSPAMYRISAELALRYDLSSLRKCVSAGETLPAAVYQRWRERTGLRIIDGLGSTELLHVFIASPDELTRAGCTGAVVPGYEAQVVDERGRPVPDGQVGRLRVRGPTGCRYLGDLEAQRRYVQDGWNYTGDAYIRHPDGYFSFHARLDDMIISLGLNVSGAEVENVLLEHPAVRECAVVGQRDERGDTLVKAHVVLAAQHDDQSTLRRDLQQHVKAQLADYKCPRWIDFVEALPRTGTGKVQRFRLRDDQRAGPAALQPEERR